MNFDNRSVFVGDLSNHCTERDLRLLFQPFGPVMAVHFHNGAASGRDCSYAFVALTSFDCVEAARKHLDGCPFMGRRIKVRRATTAQSRQHAAASNAPPNSLYVRFVSTLIDRSVTEFDLQRLFSPFGLVLDVIVKDCVIDNALGQQYGYAFVHYVSGRAGLEAAMEAMNQLNHMTFDGVTLHIELSRNIAKPNPPAPPAFPVGNNGHMGGNMGQMGGNNGHMGGNMYQMGGNMGHMGGNMGQMGRSMNATSREFVPSSRKMHPDAAGYGGPQNQISPNLNLNTNYPPFPPVSANSGPSMQSYYRQYAPPSVPSATSPRNVFAPSREMYTMTSGDSLDSSSWVAERQSFYSASATSSVTDERDDNLSYATWSLGTNLLGGSTTAPPSIQSEVPKSFGEDSVREDTSTFAFSSLCVSPPQLPLNHDA